jgi:deoxyribodipyrimidine photolyase
MISVHWYRKGLRLHDNEALNIAIKRNKKILPLVILDPWFVNKNKVGDNRMGMFLDSVRDLEDQLIEKGLGLLVMVGKAEEVFQKLLECIDVNCVTFEKDTEPYALARDKSVESICLAKKVECLTTWGHTLYDLDSLFRDNKGHTVKSYTAFL